MIFYDLHIKHDSNNLEKTCTECIRNIVVQTKTNQHNKKVYLCKSLKRIRKQKNQLTINN